MKFFIKNLIYVFAVFFSINSAVAISNNTFCNNTKHKVKIWADYPRIGCSSEHFILEPSSCKNINAGLCSLTKVKAHIMNQADPNSVASDKSNLIEQSIGHEVSLVDFCVKVKEQNPNNYSFSNCNA